MVDAHNYKTKRTQCKREKTRTAEPQVSTVLVWLIWFISRTVLHGAFLCRQTVVAILMEQH